MAALGPPHSDSARGVPRLLLRYVTVQVAGAAVVGLVAIALFVFTADLIGNLAGELRDGVPLSVVLRLQLLRVPDILVQVSWVAMLAALLLVLGQMTRRREYVAMLAGGVSMFQISMPVLFVASLLTVSIFAVQESMVPAARESMATLRGIYAREGEADLRRMVTNISYFAADRRTYVIEELDVVIGTARGIQMHRTEGGHIVESLHAATGRWDTGRRRWVWNDTVFRTFDPAHGVTGVEELPEVVSRLRASPTDLRIEKRLAMNKYNLAYLSIAQLRRRIRTLARSAQVPTGLHVVYYAKWTEPLSTLVVTMLAIPWALSVERQGVRRGAAIAVAACVGFFALRQVGLSLGRGGILPPVAAAWGPLIAAGALGTYWLYRTPT